MNSFKKLEKGNGKESHTHKQNSETQVRFLSVWVIRPDTVSCWPIVSGLLCFVAVGKVVCHIGHKHSMVESLYTSQFAGHADTYLRGVCKASNRKVSLLMIVTWALRAIVISDTSNRNNELSLQGVFYVSEIDLKPSNNVIFTT